MKKVIIIGFMVVMSLTVFGCSGNREAPSLSSEESMHIGAWVAPPPTKDNQGNYLYINESHYQDIADSGIDTIYSLYERGQTEAQLEALDMAEAVGIDYYLSHPALAGLFQGVTDTDGTIIDADYNADVALMQEILQPYESHPAFKGILVIDEPGAAPFKGLGIFREAFKEHYPDKDFYINLFPTYSSFAQRDERSYVEYIDEYIRDVGTSFLSYDHYPLMKRGDQPILTADYLMNLEIIAEKTHEADIPFWLFLQTIGFTQSTGSQWRTPDESMLRWQLMNSLAFGAKGIQHFTYWTPTGGSSESFTTGMVDQQGEKTDVYFAAQTINQELRFMEEAYLSYDWSGIMTYSPTEEEPEQFRMLASGQDNHEGIRSIEADTNLLMGIFEKDDYEKDAFVIVNFDDPALDRESHLNIRFDDASRVIVFHQGERIEQTLDRGRFEFDLAPGDGIFVIPY